MFKSLVQNTKCFIIIILVLVSISCSSSRAIQRVNVGGHQIYLKRQVWGRNGDRVWITANESLCQNPSKQNDYISDSLRQGDEILYKVKDDSLYIYGESFSAPEIKFPVQVILEKYKYDPDNPEKDEPDGYQTMSLSIKNTCIFDFY